MLNASGEAPSGAVGRRGAPSDAVGRRDLLRATRNTSPQGFLAAFDAPFEAPWGAVGRRVLQRAVIKTSPRRQAYSCQPRLTRLAKRRVAPWDAVGRRDLVRAARNTPPQG